MENHCSRWCSDLELSGGDGQSLYIMKVMEPRSRKRTREGVAGACSQSLLHGSSVPGWTLGLSGSPEPSWLPRAGLWLTLSWDHSPLWEEETGWWVAFGLSPKLT